MHFRKGVLVPLIILLLLLTAITDDASSMSVISSTYSTQSPGISPKITYNNSSGLEIVPIEICNNQNSPTPVNFQQLLQLNWSLYAEYLNANISNVRFYNSTSSIGKVSGYGVLPAWIETNNTTTATSSNVWVNMSGTVIPANGCVTIYMAFLPKNVSWNSYLGINPYLDPSSKYGYADNGNRVFLLYNNGTDLFPLKNTGTGGSGPLTISDAPPPYTHSISGTVNGGSADAATWTTDGISSTSSPSFNLPSSYIVQMKVYLSGSSALTDLLTNVNSITDGNFYVFRFDSRNGYEDLIGYYPKGSSTTLLLNTSGNIRSSTGTWYQMTVVDSNDFLSLYKASSGYYMNAYGNLEETASGVGYTGGGIAVTTDGAFSTDYWSLITVRYDPPGGIMPSVTVENVVTHFAGRQFFNNRISSYEDNATLTINSTWVSGIYTDDNGNVYWTNTAGDVMVNYSLDPNPNAYGTFSLPPLHEFYPSAGPITSIAVINYSKYQYVTLLSIQGYVYSFNMANKTWFNATNLWNLKLNENPAPWVSVTSNVNSSVGEPNSEYFFFTDYDGNVYRYNVEKQNGSWFYNSSNQNFNPELISTVSYYDEYNISNKSLFGISANTIYMLSSNGWTPLKNFHNLASITIGSINDSNDHIFIIDRYGNLYESTQSVSEIASSKNISFYYFGRIFDSGTVTSITSTTIETNTFFYLYTQITAAEMNGTLAINTNGNGFYYSNNELSPYAYQTITINTTYAIDLSSSAYYINSTNISSLHNFSLYFMSNTTGLEFQSNVNLQQVNPAMPVLLTPTEDIIVEVVVMPNDYNNTFIHFHIYFYPLNDNGVIIEYNLYVKVVNRFYYEA